jgi:glycosyltransferase involved in cell wall biosynthesis
MRPGCITVNVWVIHQHAIPPERPGGTRHFSIARNLRGEGINLHIVASNVDYLSRSEGVGPAGRMVWTEVRDGVPFHWVRTPRPGKSLLSRARGMLAFGARVRRHQWLTTLPVPDVIVGSSPSPLAALAGAALARRHRVPFVAEIRDVWPQSLIDIGRLSPHHPGILILGAVERRLYAGASRIITLLPGAAAHIEKVVPGSGARTTWIPNGVDVRLFPPPPGPPRTGPLVLMYAGAHGRANGLDTILDAFRILQPEVRAGRVRCILMGDGPEKPRLKGRASEENIQGLEFEGPVPKDQVMSRLARAHGFLMVLRDSPVFRWGISPNKLFDYMMMGRPVLFSVRTPFNPIENSGGGISVSPENPEALASAVLELLSLSSEARAAMGARGRVWVQQHHDMACLAGEFGEVLREAVAGAPQRSPGTSLR